MEELKLPFYLVEIDETDETGVNFIAHCENPAIEKNFMAFNKEVKSHKFQATSKDRKIITGPAMIPNLPIYRKDPDGTEYYVGFSAESILKIGIKFMKNGFLHNVNQEHDPEKVVDGVYMFESFFTDKSRGVICPAGFGDLPDGSWIVSYKIENDEFWNDFIKTGIFKGFSVEGIFGHRLVAPKKEKELIEIHDRILGLSAMLELLNSQ